MHYRQFGRTGWKASALGFGLMRLPTTDGKPASRNVRTEEAVRMVRYGIDHGINYVDTAYAYHGGRSERVLALALAEGYRDMVKVATKSPIWLIEKPRDFDRYLDTQLRRLRTDRIDLYLFHGLNARSWKSVVLRNRLLERAEAARRDGKIDLLGFSFHDDFEAFRTILDGYDDWSFCQIQYNYMDTKNQAGTRGLRYAASKGLGVVVMEPLLGGRLARPPPAIRRLLRTEAPDVSPSDLALRWIWDQPEVSVVLSGMSTMSQLKANLRSADRSGVGSLTEAERRLVDAVRREYLELRPIPCTKCGYCMPCPHGVDIPRNFEEYNDAMMHRDLGGARTAYARWFKKKERAGACRQCKECEPKCPQKIAISELMPQVHAALCGPSRAGRVRRG